MSDGSQITNKEIYEEILKNRTELKNSIDASEARLLLKVEELKTRIHSLEQENVDLKRKVEILEQKDKKNNIIIFGLKKTESRVTPQYICQKLKQLLDIELNELDINNTYSLGNEQNSPIKVEFLSYIKKANILRNCNKLKGTEISINHDLTYNQRQENQVLRKHLTLARKDKNNICYIRKDRLIINGNTYTSDELEGNDQGQRQINSAPSTPTLNLVKTDKVAVSKENNQNIKSSTQISTPKTGTIKKQFKPIPGNVEKPRTRSVNKI